MGEIVTDDAASGVGAAVTSIAGRGRRKAAVGGPMNLEEIRLNRGLLQ